MKRKPHSTSEKPTTIPGFKGRIWIDGEEGVFIGHGRVVLLERIREYGSLAAAAKSMGMAYRHAWDLVASMNRQSPVPFVESTTGGKGGGGARVTQAGENAIRLFWTFHEDFQKFLRKEEEKLGLTSKHSKETAP